MLRHPHVLSLVHPTYRSLKSRAAILARCSPRRSTFHSPATVTAITRRRACGSPGIRDKDKGTGCYPFEEGNNRARHMSWKSWMSKRSTQERAKEGESSNVSEGEEDAAKEAILEKAFKGRQPTELMLRCTILDAEGNVTSISGQFKKGELCSSYGLNPRDLRKVDSRIPNLVPTILVRKDAILVNILHIRALVKANTTVLFDSFGSVDSRLHSAFLWHLGHNLKAKGTGMPYEFRAIDSILLSVISALEAEMVFIRNLVGGLLAELEDDIDRDKFKRLLHYSRRLSAFQNRAKMVQKALEEVLEQDEDLAAMHLSDHLNGIKRQLADHEELEVLLESYCKQVEEIVNESNTVESNVESTQEIVELILDSNRNALLALDLQVSIVTMGIGTGALLAGLFGMNLLSHFEEHNYAFYFISGTCMTAAVVVMVGGLYKLSRIRKVGLGGSPLSGLSHSSDRWGKGGHRRARRPWISLPLRRRG